MDTTSITNHFTPVEKPIDTLRALYDNCEKRPSTKGEYYFAVAAISGLLSIAESLERIANGVRRTYYEG